MHPVLMRSRDGAPFASLSTGQLGPPFLTEVDFEIDIVLASTDKPLRLVEELPEGVSSEALTRQLALALALQEVPLGEERNWGMLNADADRVEEFVRFVGDRALEPSQMRLMLDLVLASANERLISAPEADLTRVARLLEEHPEEADRPVYDWRRFHPEMVPLAGWLRAQRSP